MPDQLSNGRKPNQWLVQIATLIIAALVFYGITTATLKSHTKQLDNLDIKKADKEVVEVQLKNILDILKEIKQDVKDLENED